MSEPGMIWRVIDLLKRDTYRRSIYALNKSRLRPVMKYLAHAREPLVSLKRRRLTGNLSHREQETVFVDRLNRSGFTQLDLDLLDTSKLEQLSGYGRQKLQEFEGSSPDRTKKFWHYLSGENEQRATDCPLVNFAIQEPILRIVSRYLGQIPFLDYVLLTLSLPSGEPLKISQLWHRDQDSHRVVKLFVYLTDVRCESDGPFTLLNQVESRKLSTGFFMKHSSDEQVFSKVSRGSVRRLMGPRLSTFIVDTERCFHMGSRLVEPHKRLLYTANFISLPSLYPWGGRRRVEIRTPVTNLQKATLRPDFSL